MGAMDKTSLVQYWEIEFKRYLLVGNTPSFGDEDRNGWVIRIDEMGNIIWQKQYRGILDDRFSSVIETSDGFIIAGQSQSFGGGVTIYC